MIQDIQNNNEEFRKAADTMPVEETLARFCAIKIIKQIIVESLRKELMDENMEAFEYKQQTLFQRGYELELKSAILLRRLEQHASAQGNISVREFCNQRYEELRNNPKWKKMVKKYTREF